MIVEQAEVVATDGQYAWVQTQRRSVCSGCQVNSACGTGIISKLLPKKATVVRVMNAKNAKVGDAVSVGMQEQGLLVSAVLTYMLPLLIVTLSLVLGSVLFAEAFSDLLVLLCGIIGFISAIIIMRRVNKHLSNSQNFLPYIIEISKTTRNDDQIILSS